MYKSIISSFFLSLFFLLLSSACNSGKLVGVVDPGNPQYDKTRITVLLKERVTPEMLVSSYEKYGLEKLGPANRTLNEWLFKWTAKLNPDVLLQDIQSSSMVKKAEFVRIYQQNN